MTHTIFDKTPLTVADWIARLQTLPPDAQVLLYPKYHTPINKFAKKRLRSADNIFLCESYGDRVWVGYHDPEGSDEYTGSQGVMLPDYKRDEEGDVYEKLPNGVPHVAIIF